MELVSLADPPDRTGPAAVKRRLGEALGATDLALNYFELAPGDSFAFGYHAHERQEEVFYVQSGTVTFRTETGPVAVGAGELVRFAPGEYQRGVNEGSERVVALAMGAPRDAGETDVRRRCPTCEAETSQDLAAVEGGTAIVATCVECGTETGRFE